MNTDHLLREMRATGRNALNEHESKQLLKKYGVPVVSEMVVSDKDAAVHAALALGFPVVLKGLGSTLLHKTERGLVHVNLANPQAVAEAAHAIISEAKGALDGLLVQPHIPAKREFMAGLFQDETFGPVIMFGLGGIFAEALSDVSFRLAPLNETDAIEMIDQIKAKGLLEKFRGEAAANRDQLVQTLLGLSRVGTKEPNIAEIDINPLLVNATGEVCAVDALVIMSANTKSRAFLPPVKPFDLGYFFHPKSIAFVGASAQMGKWGHILLASTISGGFEGEIYPVNPKGGTIAGRKVYPSIRDIPDKVDLAVVTIPASKVMDLIPQFEEKGIQNMLLITSGFGEIGSAGKTLERDLIIRANKAGILVLGPNTMGICNPHIKLYCTGVNVRPIPGSTAVVAQSGNMGTQLLAFAEQQGIGIRGFCGSGNEAMIAIEDYLDAFETDELTRTVLLYIESVKNGRRFYESALRVGKKKPVVLLKGGQSKAGNQAAASHTGALTTNADIFNAVCRQAGIVKVEQSMDLLDLSASFSSLPLPKGKRAAVMTLGGGWGVVTADLCSAYGLELPELPPEMIKHFDTLLPPYWSKSNPVDLVGEPDNTLPMIVIEELLKWEGCDAVINLGILGRKIMLKSLGESVLKADPTYSHDFIDSVNREFSKFEEQYVAHIVNLMEKYDKPIFGVSLMKDSNDYTVYRVDNHHFKGVFFETPERAVKAFAKMFEYHRFLTRQSEISSAEG